MALIGINATFDCPTGFNPPTTATGAIAPELTFVNYISVFAEPAVLAKADDVYP